MNEFECCGQGCCDHETKSKALQHKHLIVRALVTEPPIKVKKTKKWILSVIESLGMEVLMGPHVKYHKQKGNRGITALCGITTSHLAMHVWDEVEPALLEFDVYTCGAMDVETVLAKIAEFKPIRVEYKYLDREHGLEEISSHVSHT